MVDAFLSGDHPTPHALRLHVTKNILWWELWTERMGGARVREVDERAVQFLSQLFTCWYHLDA